mmetsp:Transcript_10967/g.28494  ORF Transcript_10967/g.28494 Transcript_10967/m.28494 type:complete len:366 (+) Transcript_10967:229-1326(+)
MGEAGAPARQIIVLNASDRHAERKELAIWQYAYDEHVRGALSDELAGVRWFLRVDDDTYVSAARIGGLLHELRCHAHAPFVGGTPYWMAGHPSWPRIVINNRRGKRRAVTWGGQPLFDGYGRRAIDSRFKSERSLAREPLVYCHGGPGMLVTRAALALGGGFGDKCIAAFESLERTGCGAYTGRVHEWIPREGEAGPRLGDGGTHSLLHRLMCRTAAQHPPLRSLSKPPYWKPLQEVRGIADVLFGFCLQQEHSAQLRCLRVACNSRAGKLADVFSAKSHVKVRPTADGGKLVSGFHFPEDTVSVHGLHTAEQMELVHARHAAALTANREAEGSAMRGRVVVVDPQNDSLAMRQCRGPGQPTRTS